MLGVFAGIWLLRDVEERKGTMDFVFLDVTFLWQGNLLQLGRGINTTRHFLPKQIMNMTLSHYYKSVSSNVCFQSRDSILLQAKVLIVIKRHPLVVTPQYSESFVFG